MVRVILLNTKHFSSPPKTPKKTVIRAQSMFNYDDIEVEDTLRERDERIRELEEIIAKQDLMMKEFKHQMTKSETETNDSQASIEINDNEESDDS